jgi:glyoxylase-like metal-dependent hydrolase (beta-lactamase superfamily II)
MLATPRLIDTMRFTVGEVRIDIIVDDDDFEAPLGHFLPGSDAHQLAHHRGLLEPDFLDFDRNVVKFAIQCFVVRVNGRTILVDTCVGEQKDRPEIPAWNQRRGTGFLERLAKTGVDPADVDIVFCTHLHVDHVGWNTQRQDKRWVPTFPNARYLIGRDELADWMAQRDAGSAPAIHILALQDSVLPVVEAGLVDLVEDGHDLAAGLTLVPLPGHTAHQMGLRINRHDGHAIFCGDALHSPVQILDPSVSTSSCADPKVAATTRRILLEDAVETKRLVVPAHFRGHRCAHIRCRSGGFEPVFSCQPG